MGGDGRLKKQATMMSLTDIQGSVKELKAAAYEEKEKVVHLMDVVAHHQSQNPAALVSGGAIKPLIDLIDSGNDGSQIHAASCLAIIATTKMEYQDKIVAAGAIPPLVKLLKMGSNKAMTYAAEAIAAISEQRKYQEPILKAGAILPLCRLVRGDVTVDTQVHASDAVANLAAQNPEAQHTFFSQGIVPLLLELLQNGKAQKSAADALAQLLSPQAVDNAPANTEIQEEIAKDGGIPPLLALLSGMNVDAQVHAAEALSNLARGNGNTQTIIAKAGGIGPLLAMLSIKSSAAQAQAASALAQLTRQNVDNQSSISRQGGIPSLSLLLQNNEASVQAMAALALTEVCRENMSNQTEAAEGGCIISLVEQLKSTTSSAAVDAVKAEAVGALWVLSQNHGDNKVTVSGTPLHRPAHVLLATAVPPTVSARRPAHLARLPPPAPAHPPRPATTLHLFPRVPSMLPTRGFADLPTRGAARLLPTTDQ